MASFDRRVVQTAAAMALALSVVAGCLGNPTKIEADIAAAEDLNPDHRGRASPLVVRIYQLKSDLAFNNASFFALYDNDEAELGADLVGKEEIELRPGEDMVYSRKLEDDTRFVGVLAGYRDIDNASWRAVTEIKKGKTTEVKLDFARLKVSVMPKD